MLWRISEISHTNSCADLSTPLFTRTATKRVRIVWVLLQGMPPNTRNRKRAKAAAAPDACKAMLELTHDELEVIVQISGGALKPQATAHLSSTCRLLHERMAPLLETLKTERLAALALCRHPAVIGMTASRLYAATEIRCVVRSAAEGLRGNHAATFGMLFRTNALPQLQQLRLTGNRLGDDGIRQMIGGMRQRGALPELRMLTLASTGFGEGAARALADALAAGALPSLAVLHLGDNQIGDGSSLALLLARLRDAPRLTRLHVHGNALTHASVAKLLAPPVALQSVSMLNLSNNRIGDEGMAALATAIRGGSLPQLTELLLHANSHASAEARAEALAALHNRS